MRLNAPVAGPGPPTTNMPLFVLFDTAVSEMNTVLVPLGEKTIPEFVKLWTRDFWIFKDWPELNWIPVVPELAPSISSPRRLTTSFGPALTVIAAPLVASTPAIAPSLVMVTALLIFRAP